MKKIVIVSMLFFANTALAQQQFCRIVSPTTEAKFQAMGISFPQAVTEYMTAVQLTIAEDRASNCEFPPAETIRGLDTAIAWRVLKFAKAQGPQFDRLLVEYAASGGGNTLTGSVAIKWLKHNALVAKFNAWDAADVGRNFQARGNEVSNVMPKSPTPSANENAGRDVVQKPNLLGFLGGMTGVNAKSHALQIGFKLKGCEDKGNEFEYCRYLRNPDEELLLIMGSDELDSADYKFGAERYKTVLSHFSKEFGTPSQNGDNQFKTVSWVSSSGTAVLQLVGPQHATLTFMGGKRKQHLEEMQRASKAENDAIPNSGDAELVPGVHFRYVRYLNGYMLDTICSQITYNKCYPRGWQPWLKELERRTAGEQMAALGADIGLQGPGNLVISWDTQERVVFYCGREHSGGAASVFFIFAPKTQELDIVWQNEDGIRYLGPNASMLKSAHVYDWLKSIPDKF